MKCGGTRNPLITRGGSLRNSSPKSHIPNFKKYKKIFLPLSLKIEDKIYELIPTKEPTFKYKQIEPYDLIALI